VCPTNFAGKLLIISVKSIKVLKSNRINSGDKHTAFLLLFYYMPVNGHKELQLSLTDILQESFNTYQVTEPSINIDYVYILLIFLTVKG
jgi:hypothetical protein